jgi:hypothetical protein
VAGGVGVSALGVLVGLVRGMACRLQLERAVLCIKVGAKAGGQLVQDLVRAFRAKQFVLHHYVGGEHGNARRYGPDVDVMDSHNPRHGKDVLPDHLHLYALGARLQEDVTTSRSRCQARGRIMIAMMIEAIVSAAWSPVNMMVRAAAMTANDPSRSPSTSR